MSDPSEMTEFRLPSGEVMWIDPAAVDAARSRQEDSTMVSVAKANGDGVAECPQTGIYTNGRGNFRFYKGDKMPAGLKLVEKADVKAKNGKGGAAKADATGPAETA